MVWHIFNEQYSGMSKPLAYSICGKHKNVYSFWHVLCDVRNYNPDTFDQKQLYYIIYSYQLNQLKENNRCPICNLNFIPLWQFSIFLFFFLIRNFKWYQFLKKGRLYSYQFNAFFVLINVAPLCFYLLCSINV